MNGKTGLYAVIGKPISHSRSPEFHNKWLMNYTLNDVYLPFEVDDLNQFMSAAKTLQIKGFNVTVPYKVAIMALLDEIDDLALKIGAVNTVHRKDDKWIGYNTDVYGFEKTVAKSQNAERVLLVGAGGASRCVAAFYAAQGKSISIVNRTDQKAEQLAEEFGHRKVNFSVVFDEPFDLIVNATSLGLKDSDDACIDLNQFSQKPISVIDLIYQPETTFLKTAKKLGIHAINGETMLVEQAKKAFQIWTGILPD
jgi:shikimate dehydrogenase